ncbi:MAG TPA: molecular chaperone [bacterium]|nr:molecular chaperone [bacterium]
MRNLRDATARSLLLAVVFLCAFCGGLVSVQAANLGVSPLRVELAPGQTSAVLSLNNHGDKAVVVQLEAVRWTQENGQDVYAPTRDLVASPPVFTLEPGAVQLIRIGLRKPADDGQEMAYRLFLQEVPGALSAGRATVQMALKISLPVFVLPKEVVRKLEWSLQRTTDGRLRLRAQNLGTTRVQLVGLVVYAPGDSKPLASEAQMSYVLAGQSRDWLLTPKDKLPATLSMLRVQSGSDNGRIEQDVQLQAP